MKSTGIVRRIDDLGRVVIPKEIRRTNGIKEGDPMEIYVEDNGIIAVKKYEAGCMICGGTDNVIEFKDKDFCRSCIKKIKKL
jgi:AbrB family transcriptional regulator, transcriptional pleiotropic regulator of transition state genes